MTMLVEVLKMVLIVLVSKKEVVMTALLLCGDYGGGAGDRGVMKVIMM